MWPLKRIIVVIGAAMVISQGVWAQPAQAPLSFEVASVKLHPMEPGHIVILIPSSRGPRIQARGDRFTDDVVTLNDLIMEAYDVLEHQISGSPTWAVPPLGDHYDIAAKTDGIPTASQLQQMLQTLLADRFHLKLHREMRELPVYALVIGKNGSKLRQLREGERAPTYPTRPVERPATVMSTIPVLIRLISNVVDRPVVDQTGLAGTYEFANLDWAQFGRAKRAGALDTLSGESVFAALQQELGLKLEPRKDPVEVLVIDHVEKPTEN